MNTSSSQENYLVDLVTVLGKQQEENNGLSKIRKQTFAKYEYIYQSGEVADTIFVIKKGRVKIESKIDASRNIIKNVCIAGEFFGEYSIIGVGSRTDSAIALERTELFILSLEELFYQMRSHSNLTTNLINILGARLASAERKIESFIFKNSRTRIIEYLDELAKKRGQKVGFEIVVRNFLTHQEIANITATSRQTVTTVLNELRNKNILIFNRKRLLIRDLDLLKAEAHNP